MCHESDAVVEGRIQSGDELRVEHVYKDARSVIQKGGTIRITGLDKHDRVVGRRMDGTGGTRLDTTHVVAFLRYDARTKRWTPVAPWDSAGRGLQGSSGIYWADGGRLYHYDQAENPGPTYLIESQSPASVAELRRAIQVGLSKSKQFRAALALEDPEAKAVALAQYLIPRGPRRGRDSTFRYRVRKPMRSLGSHAVSALMKELGKHSHREDLREVLVILYDLGPAATPAARQLISLLDKHEFHSNHSYAISALRRIGDRSAIPALRRVFERGGIGRAAEAAEALAALGDVESFVRIAQRLPQDPVPGDCWKIAQLLEALHTLDASKARVHVERFVDHPAMKHARDRVAHLTKR